MIKDASDKKADEVYADIHMLSGFGVSASVARHIENRVRELPVQTITEGYLVVIGGRLWLPEQPADAANMAALKQEIENHLRDMLPGVEFTMGEMIDPGVWRVSVGKEGCIIRAWKIHYKWARLFFWVILGRDWEGDIPDALMKVSDQARHGAHCI